jgi:hypothetical protein
MRPDKVLNFALATNQPIPKHLLNCLGATDRSGTKESYSRWPIIARKAHAHTDQQRVQNTTLFTLTLGLLSVQIHL